MSHALLLRDVQKIYEDAFVTQAITSTGFATTLWWQWAGDVLCSPVLNDSVVHFKSASGSLIGCDPFVRNKDVIPFDQDRVKPWTRLYTQCFNDMLKRTVSARILTGILGERHPDFKTVSHNKTAFGTWEFDISAGISVILRPEEFVVGAASLTAC
jgi:hypothetical protein